jgi:pyridoxine 5-phosphate synthase
MTTQAIALHVNIDHVATLRQARGTFYPDPVESALIALRAGARGITVHLREDRRHIQDRDVRVLREVIEGTLNLEMAATQEMLSIARAIKPTHVTLVPERRQEQTTEGGLSVQKLAKELAPTVSTLVADGILVSLFVAPDRGEIQASHDIGAQQVELHTGEYAHAHLPDQRDRELNRLRDAASYARELGLRVAAGHGLNLHNVAAMVEIDPIVELNIGHAIVADAVFVGFAEAVRRMLRAIERPARCGSTP